MDPQGEPTGDPPSLDEDELLRIYRAMAATRRVDERCMKLQRQGRIGFYGASTGEEAAAVGSAAALDEEDWVFPALRQGGVMLYRGWSLEKWFHHLFGNEEAAEKGRSMPCHFSDRDVNQVSWSSCMATQLPHAVGMAYAADYQGDDTVAAAYLGDGATSEGDFHTAMNFAGVWDAPVVFICNNNHWAISVPSEKQTASETFAQKAEAYGFEGHRVDGNDVLAMYEATREAVEKARRGEGPTMIEAVTYRIRGHSTSDDPSRYRDEEEVEDWRRKDPLHRYQKYLVMQDVAAPDDFEAIHEEIEAEIEEALAAAEEGSPPDLESTVEDVYDEVPPHLADQMAALKNQLEE
ncbi:pyruvate dehydrogenase (acetyl-transferring) E1 component subunit alpha [Thermoplasmatales archaeon SW_10_69_26]|nr:MAG: pyruvate dehydrogenase (acetyl-transferring) E1 component subunit alpha [Thermoplasmatales archaeon SW_10_69_26]